LLIIAGEEDDATPFRHKFLARERVFSLSGIRAAMRVSWSNAMPKGAVERGGRGRWSGSSATIGSGGREKWLDD